MAQDAPPFDLRDADSYRHWTRVTIRFSDEDRLGHVNNAAYAVWLEAARVGYIESLFDKGAVAETVLARLEIDFIQETRFPGEVQIGSRLVSVGRRSFASAYAVFRDGQCLTTCRCVNVFFDPRERRSVDPLPAVREALLAAL